jgi:hypothetical protein
MTRVLRDDDQAEREVSPSRNASHRARRPVDLKLRWTVVGGIHGKNSNIPAASGIYAYGEVQRVGGLPSSVSWVYIGQSVNLRQRIAVGHDMRFEKNRALRDWMRRTKRDAELWFAPVDQCSLDEVERQLVSLIQPMFNIQHKSRQSSF